MSYKVVNNILNSQYGVDTVPSFFSFRKISSLGDIKNIKYEEKEKLQKNEKIAKINNKIIESSMYNISIDKLLDDIPNELMDIVEDIELKGQVFTDKEKNEEERLEAIVNIEKENINELEINHKDPYKDIIYNFFNTNGKNKVFSKELDAIYTYKRQENLTRYDLGCIARSINKIFSLYFQSLFDEVGNILQDHNINSTEGFIKKLQNNKKLETYEMFRFVNRTYESNYKNIISSLKKQENKDKFNILKSFLEFKAKTIKYKDSFFYLYILNYLKSLRDYHAHEDFGNIEKISKRTTPIKQKEQLFSNFLGNLDENGNGLLQFIINKALDVGEILETSE